MSRYDKYDNLSGGFRAPLLDATNDGEGDSLIPIDTVVGVGLDSSGRVVIGAGDTGVKGVVVVTRVMNAGDIVDVMTSGEIVEFGGNPGTVYYAASDDGEVDDSGDVAIGYTVEGDRLVVRLPADVSSGDSLEVPQNNIPLIETPEGDAETTVNAILGLLVSAGIMEEAT